MTSVQRKLAGLTSAQRAALQRNLVPRVVSKYMRHTPWPKQQVFLTLNCKEAFYGGAAGGGKSDALLMAALQYVDVPGYSALILRRTWPDLNSAGAIMDRARQWLSGTDARMHEGGRYWTFPTNGAPARLSFGHLLHENDKHRYASAEFQFVAFDELTHFQESQYSFLFSRLRRPSLPCVLCGVPVREYQGRWKHTSKTDCKNVFPDPQLIDQFRPAHDGLRLWDVPLRMRSASNPGSIGHEWVFRRFVDPTTRQPATRFMPANLHDNPAIDQAEYIEALNHLNALDRERLLNGDWSAADQGEIFQRHWLDVVDEPPSGTDIQRCRYWDMAATELKKGQDPDFTVGTLLALKDGQWFVEHQIRGQWNPKQTEEIVKQTAMTDGPYVMVRMEEEGGSSGKIVTDHYKRHVLVGFNFDGIRSSGSKVARAQPIAVAAESGNVKLVAGAWNKRLLDELELFPLGAHDDQVDSLSGAFNALAFQPRRARLLLG